MVSGRVRATPQALEVIERLRSKHGELAFLQPGSCADGTSPVCLTRGELQETDSDLNLGAIEGAPFLTDREQYERSGKPKFVLDVSPGAPSSLSLEGAEDVHFVVHSH